MSVSINSNVRPGIVIIVWCISEYVRFVGNHIDVCLYRTRDTTHDIHFIKIDTIYILLVKNDNIEISNHLIRQTNLPNTKHHSL